MNYATLDDVKKALGLQDTTKDDDVLALFLGWATTQIEQVKNRFYDPRVDTRLYDIPGVYDPARFGQYGNLVVRRREASPLRFDADLLELETLTNGDGTEITAYLLEPGNRWPKMRVRLTGDSGWEPDADGNRRQVISVKGVWGSHDKYPYAWQDSGQTVQNDPLLIGATTITVADSAIFQAGQLLKLGDEFALLTGIAVTPGVDPAPDTHTLTVERHANGSTASAHDKNTPISIWQVQGNVNQACVRLVKWRYTQKDVDVFDKTYNAEAGITTVPTAIPVDVLQLLGSERVMLP